MAKNTASESALSELHGRVATVLDARISHMSDETTFNAEGEEVPTGEKIYDCSDQSLAAAIKFLKDNQITADIENNSQMGNLKETLARKKKHSRLSQVTPIDAARAISE